MSFYVDTRILERGIRAARRSVRRFRRESDTVKLRVIDLDTAPEENCDKLAILESNEVIIWRRPVNGG